MNKLIHSTHTIMTIFIVYQLIVINCSGYIIIIMIILSYLLQWQLLPLGEPSFAVMSGQHIWETPPTLHTAALKCPMRTHFVKHEVRFLILENAVLIKFYCSLDLACYQSTKYNCCDAKNVNMLNLKLIVTDFQ